MRKSNKPAPTTAPRTHALTPDLLAVVTGGDVYMHNPRGGNNRLDG